MFKPTLAETLAVLNDKGYNLPEGSLSFVAVRTSRTASNTFDDTFFMLQHDTTKVFPCTTDPGSYWLKNGLSKGTAVLKPGQYVDCWKLGKHKGQYAALVQCRPVTVYRDRTKDLELDYNATETGMFGINIHRASGTGVSKLVDKWSAGCIVLQSVYDFNVLMEAVKKSVSEGQRYFTLTLLERNDYAI